MARGKGNARRQAEEQAQKRRNSAAHRSLRRRAQKGVGARAAQPDEVVDETPTDYQPIDQTAVDEVSVESPLEGSATSSDVSDSAAEDGDSVGFATDPHEDADSTADAVDDSEPVEPDFTAEESQESVQSEEPVQSEKPQERPAPAWLAAGAIATAQASDDVYVPRAVVPLPNEDEDEPTDEPLVDAEDVEGPEADPEAAVSESTTADSDDDASYAPDPVPVLEPDAETDPEPELGAEPVVGSAADQVVEPELESDEDVEPGQIPELEPESEFEPEAEPEAEPEPELEAEPQFEAASDADAEPWPEPEPAPASAAEDPEPTIEAAAVPALEDDDPQEVREDRVPTRASVFADPVEEPPAEDGVAESRTGGVESDQTAVHEPVGDTAVFAPVEEQSVATPGAPVTRSDEIPAAIPPRDEAPTGPRDDVLDTDDGDGTGSKSRRAAWAVPLVIAVIGVIYLGAQALLSNTVPRGTEVLGEAIGGQSSSEATATVTDAASSLAGDELELRVAEQTFTLLAADAGLSIDPQRTVDQVTGFTVMPGRLWAHIAGGSDLTPVIEVDEQALADAVETASVQLDGPAQDAGVAFADGSVEVVPGRSSIVVDQEASATRIAQAWPGVGAIELVAESEPPTITDEDAAAFAAELETETLSAPVTLSGDDAEATVDPATIAANATVESGPSGLALVVDGQALAEQIIEDNPELTTSGQNASVSFDDNQKIVIDEGSPGITIDGEALGEAVLEAANSADRLGELPYTAADPEVSAEDLRLDDFKEIVSSFDTGLTSERVRTQNLRVAAADVQGVIVQPGESFDLTEALSPINEEEGYQPAHVIVNGILTNGMGGGLSQMATTVYNAGYFAGYEILDHRPHSVWLTRYPAGRESTIYTGSINVEMRNNTPYAAVFNSYISGGRLHVDIWSTKHFEVNTSASPKTNIQQPGVKEVTSANCEAKGPGQPGFTITNTRTVLLDGEEVDRTSDTWTYKPDDAVRCVSANSNNDD